MKILHWDVDEDYKYLKGHEDYIINKNGKVLSLKWGKVKELSQPLSVDNYRRVKIDNQYQNVHRLVAETFLKKENETFQVNHKDGNKENNHYSNLEWVSQKENLYHAMDMGLHKRPRQKIKGTNIKTGDVLEFDSQTEATNAGFDQQNISSCLLGKRKTCKGYKWEMAE